MRLRKNDCQRRVQEQGAGRQTRTNSARGVMNGKTCPRTHTL
jgi:hypothetical protein